MSSATRLSMAPAPVAGERCAAFMVRWARRETRAGTRWPASWSGVGTSTRLGPSPRPRSTPPVRRRRRARPASASRRRCRRLSSCASSTCCATRAARPSRSAARPCTPPTSTAGTTRCRTSRGCRARRPHRPGTPYDVVDLGDDTRPRAGPPRQRAARVASSRGRGWRPRPRGRGRPRRSPTSPTGMPRCLATLLGAAPEVAGAEPADVAADLLAHLPPALAVVDALGGRASGSDGDGSRSRSTAAPSSSATDPVLADGAGAALLGLDRSASPLVERALRALGPPGGRRRARLAPCHGAHAAHPLARAAARSVAAEPRLARVLSAADRRSRRRRPCATRSSRRVRVRPHAAGRRRRRRRRPASAGRTPRRRRRRGGSGSRAWSTGAGQGRRGAPRGAPRVRPRGIPGGANMTHCQPFSRRSTTFVEGLPENDDGMRWTPRRRRDGLRGGPGGAGRLRRRGSPGSTSPRASA